MVKADVQGSAEVLGEMLPKLSTDLVKLKIISTGVGAVTENDVLFASASGAIIIAFGVRPDRKAADLAQQEHVDIRTHKIIYEVSDEIKKAMDGLLEPVLQEPTWAAPKCAMCSASRVPGPLPAVTLPMAS